jgi:hypothetical protein
LELGIRLVYQKLFKVEITLSGMGQTKLAQRLLLTGTILSTISC